jgi:hypothetical protein
MDWQPIETIPEEMLDGREVMVKRVYEGKIVKQGMAVFGVCHDSAPQRSPIGADPLGRLTLADYVRENEASQLFAEQRKWLRPDRMYSFPTPTHWAQQDTDR